MTSFATERTVAHGTSHGTGTVTTPFCSFREDRSRKASSRAETTTSTTTAAEAASVIVRCFFSAYLSFMVRVLCFTCGLYLPAHECPYNDTYHARITMRSNRYLSSDPCCNDNVNLRWIFDRLHPHLMLLLLRRRHDHKGYIHVPQLVHSTLNSMLAPIDDTGENAGMVMIVAVAVPLPAMTSTPC